MHAHSKLFAVKIVDSSTSESEAQDILKAKNSLLDAINILNDHNSVTGGTKELVQLDNLSRLEKAIEFSQTLFNKHLAAIAEQDLHFDSVINPQAFVHCNNLPQNSGASTHSSKSF